MRGRKPDQLAARRLKDKAELSTGANGGRRGELAKPASVCLSPNMAEIWDSIVGTGLAYDERDAPMLEQLVFYLEAARQAREECTSADGTLLLMVGKGEPDPATGRYLDYKPNPYLKVMDSAVDKALKLADQLGVTPLARARLGLTQAQGKAVTLSISDAIDRYLDKR